MFPCTAIYKRTLALLGTNSAASAQFSGTFQDSSRRFRGTNTGGSGLNLADTEGTKTGGSGLNLVRRGATKGSLDSETGTRGTNSVGSGFKGIMLIDAGSPGAVLVITGEVSVPRGFPSLAGLGGARLGASEVEGRGAAGERREYDDGCEVDG